MALKLTVGLSLIAWALLVRRADSAVPIVELDLRAGASSIGTNVVGSELRVFGDGPRGSRYFVETSTAAHQGADSDAFATVYPYEQRFSLLDAYVERSQTVEHVDVNVRLGRFRTPFGIYSASDQGYVGFTRPPLMRYADNEALSNFWMEGGGDFTVGSPQLKFEASMGTPQEAAQRPHGTLDILMRVQGFRGPFIVGISHLTTHAPEAEGSGSAQFTGIDLRWSVAGVQIRGEWLRGASSSGVVVEGGYVDALIHRVGMERVTPIARLDAIGIESPHSRRHPMRALIGARYRASPRVDFDLVLVQPFDGSDTALDFGLSCSHRLWQ